MPVGFGRSRRPTLVDSVRWVDRRLRCAGITPASPIRRRAGRNRAASWPRSSGIPASFIRASASSSPTWRGRPSASSPSTTTAAPASSTSKRARARSSGPGCRAVPSPPMPCAFSSMLWPTTWAISCGRWRCPRRRSRGR